MARETVVLCQVERDNFWGKVYPDHSGLYATTYKSRKGGITKLH